MQSLFFYCKCCCHFLYWRCCLYSIAMCFVSQTANNTFFVSDLWVAEVRTACEDTAAAARRLGRPRQRLCYSNHPPSPMFARYDLSPILFGTFFFLSGIDFNTVPAKRSSAYSWHTPGSGRACRSKVHRRWKQSRARPMVTILPLLSYLATVLCSRKFDGYRRMPSRVEPR